MALLCSISGIRGTLAGTKGSALTLWDVLRYVGRYADWLLREDNGLVVVLGRDARPSGVAIAQTVGLLLRGRGFEVVDIGLTTTPTAQLQVVHHGAAGGIMITASHNDAEWNALKLLDTGGSFLSEGDMQYVLGEEEGEGVSYAWDSGVYRRYGNAIDDHIAAIVAHPLVDTAAIASAGFRVGLDPVNSTGGLALVPLLRRIGVGVVEVIHGTPDGNFARVPEPLPAHLTALSALVREKNLHIGIAVDPDVDRLALVGEDGVPFGEDYTLVMAADYVLAHRKGPLVANLSSTKALADVAAKHGVPYHQSAVGERHVVEEMRRVQAVIGGEGNGGVIDPQLHYGRDALIGVGLILSFLAQQQLSATALRATYPNYAMVKAQLPRTTTVEPLLARVAEAFAGKGVINRVDGLHVRLDVGWVHVRPSNTEPILRIYAEAADERAAKALVAEVQAVLA